MGGRGTTSSRFARVRHSFSKPSENGTASSTPTAQLPVAPSPESDGPYIITDGRILSDEGDDSDDTPPSISGGDNGQTADNGHTTSYGDAVNTLKD